MKIPRYSPEIRDRNHSVISHQVSLSKIIIDNLSYKSSMTQIKMPPTNSGGFSIGEATINVVLSEFSDISRFDTAKHLASFIGLAPRHRLSGTSVRGRSAMSKIGNAQIRKSLFMPALVTMKYNPILIEMRSRLLKAGKPKMLIVGAAMRKLVHIIYGVLKNNQPFNPDVQVKNA